MIRVSQDRVSITRDANRDGAGEVTEQARAGPEKDEEQ